MKHFLAWAEKRGTSLITTEALESSRGWMDNNLYVVGRFLWAFLTINLTGTRPIYPFELRRV